MRQARGGRLLHREEDRRRHVSSGAGRVLNTLAAERAGVDGAVVFDPRRCPLPSRDDPRPTERPRVAPSPAPPVTLHGGSELSAGGGGAAGATWKSADGARCGPAGGWKATCGEGCRPGERDTVTSRGAPSLGRRDAPACAAGLGTAGEVAAECACIIAAATRARSALSSLSATSASAAAASATAAVCSAASPSHSSPASVAASESWGTRHSFAQKTMGDKVYWARCHRATW